MTKCKKIKFLTDSFGNSAGEVVSILEETKEELYYYDGFHRWCYVYKNEENVSFMYVYTGGDINE